ncbi:hypothetical protein ACTPOK_14620 [Streptomyces inhibens]|uniref:hypothetical protein n=1 Tax=Streptomyces inhibens TaxID=2293571 RepID=UPI00402A8D2A
MLKADGRVDELVTALSTDLEPDGSTHLVIAFELDRAGRRDAAVAWAERGLSDTGTAPPRDRRLVEFLAHHYEEAGRLTDLVRVRRDDFATTAHSARTAACGPPPGPPTAGPPNAPAPWISCAPTPPRSTPATAPTPARS